LHPKNRANVIVNGKIVGVIGAIIGENWAFCEVDLNEIGDFTRVVNFPAPSKYQKNKLDFTFEHDGVYADIENIFNKFSHPLNMGFKLKDVYGNKYTIEFTAGSYEKTLTSDDINDIWAKIIDFGRKKGLTLKE
jgi:phenylalanyl-tRNA synthetase beta subunit